MRVSTLVPFAAVSSAFVIPDESVMNQIAIESQQADTSSIREIWPELPAKDEVVDYFEESVDYIVDSSKNALDEALSWASDSVQAATESLEEEYFDVKSWVESADFGTEDDGHHHDGPHHGRPGHRRPHHPVKSNKTVYQLISESKYSTKLAALINDDAELVELLNGTSTNFTVFAPTDKAFEKIPDHGKKPSKDIIRKVLSYHISNDFYPAGRVLVTRTVPTLLEGDNLSHDPALTPQRLSTNIGLKGLTVNYYSRIVAIDIFGSNGVIHGIDSILIPPPKATRVISFLPSEFSTLELGLVKTGLYPVLNDTSNHLGGTLFAPSNAAFQRLGARANAFLFSKYGQKYLKAILKYHVVANQTLYSDAFYKSSGGSDAEVEGVPKGKYHVDLPTLLEDRYLSIDIARFGRLIDVRINGFQSVAVPDGIVKDGVIHVVGFVIIPPKKLGSGELQQYDGGEIEVEDLKERLEALVEKDADETEEITWEWEFGRKYDL